MNFNEYAELAQRTSNTQTWQEKLENAVLGLAGEAGEVVDLYKKFRFQGHDLALWDMIEELGDQLWYIVECIRGLEMYARELEGCEDIPFFTLDIAAKRNIEKLRERCPHGFEANRSINREE